MNEERLLKVIVAPHISEKSTLQAEQSNQVVFKVLPSATKIEIKAAVETLFKVTVEKVNLLNVKGKTKRTMRGMGKRKDWKKAYVTVAQGQEIDYTKLAD